MCCILSTIRRHDTGQSGNYRTHIEGLGRETKHTRSDFFLPPTFGVEMANNEIYSMVFFFFSTLASVNTTFHHTQHCVQVFPKKLHSRTSEKTKEPSSITTE